MSSLRTRRIKRVLIPSYGNFHVPELIKILDERRYCLFVLFESSNDISTIQKILGKKRLVPILMDKVSDESKDVSDELLKNLPGIDAVINTINSHTVTKFYEKRKRFNTVEVKLNKTSPVELKNILEAQTGPCLINLLPSSINSQNSIQINDIFNGPIATNLSTSLRNSIRKLFPKALTPSDSNSATAAPGPSSTASTSKNATTSNPKSFSLKLRKSTENIPKSESTTDIQSPKKRSLSLLRRKKSIQLESNQSDPRDFTYNLICEKENKKFKKALNKIHAESNHRFNKSIKKLNSGKLKKQRSSEKLIEEEMNREKGVLESKSNEINATTLSRASALTPATANRIVAAREARINKEVCRNANKKKFVEFEKIEDTYNEKLKQLKNKSNEETLKLQTQLIQRIVKKYQDKLLDSDQKSINAATK